MNRVKEITEKKKAARLDKGAAARFVRSALYEPEEKDARKSASKKKSEGARDTPPSKLSKRRWRCALFQELKLKLSGCFCIKITQTFNKPHTQRAVGAVIYNLCFAWF